jgi:hypothetical protein
LFYTFASEIILISVRNLPLDLLTLFFLGAWFDYVNVSPQYLLSGFSDSPEEGILSVLWKKYENAFDKVQLRS